MGFQVRIQEVNVEKIQNGKGGYEVANVNYLYKGEVKTTKIMSFSNPQVFKDVQKFVGKTVDVSTTQNGKYTNWAKLELVADEPASAGKSDVVKSMATRSTYETPEERAQRQLMIVRQSSITNALGYLAQTQKEGDFGVNDVLDIAQHFVDFVYAKEPLGAIEDLPDDIPE